MVAELTYRSVARDRIWGSRQGKRPQTVFTTNSFGREKSWVIMELEYSGNIRSR